MAFGYLVAAVVAAIIAIFALQNGTPTSVRFLAWSLEAVPLAGVVLVALAAGLIIAGLPLWVSAWRWRSRARALQARVANMEKTQAQRPPAPDPGKSP